MNIQERGSEMIYIHRSPKNEESWYGAMATDGTPEELHQFAEVIGLQQEGFHSANHANLPQYELKYEEYQKAIEEGAEEINEWGMVQLIRLWRKRKEVDNAENNS